MTSIIIAVEEALRPEFEKWMIRHMKSRGRTNTQGLLRREPATDGGEPIYAEVETYFAYLGWCAACEKFGKELQIMANSWKEIAQ